MATQGEPRQVRIVYGHAREDETEAAFLTRHGFSREEFDDSLNVVSSERLTHPPILGTPLLNPVKAAQEDVVLLTSDEAQGREAQVAQQQLTEEEERLLRVFPRAVLIRVERAVTEDKTEDLSTAIAGSLYAAFDDPAQVPDSLQPAVAMIQQVRQHEQGRDIQQPKMALRIPPFTVSERLNALDRSRRLAAFQA
jgi:hypothetical protein